MRNSNNLQILSQKWDDTLRANEGWINLLINGDKEKEKEFNKILVANRLNIVLAIMQFRRNEMKRGRGQNITLDELKESWGTNKAIKLLQELFLEQIQLEYIAYFNKVTEEKGYSIDDALKKLYNKHKEDKEKRFMNIVLVL